MMGERWAAVLVVTLGVGSEQFRAKFGGPLKGVVRFVIAARLDRMHR